VAQHQRELDVEQLVDRADNEQRFIRGIQLADAVEVGRSHDIHRREHVLLREPDPHVHAPDP
jgi:hypothetical protein